MKGHLPLIFVGLVVLTVGYLGARPSFRSRTDGAYWVRAARAKLTVIQRVGLDDVACVDVVMSRKSLHLGPTGSVSVHLDAKTDRQDVRSLLKYMKRIRVEEECNCDFAGDAIVVVCKESEQPRGFVLRGCLDPGNAPIIWKAMCSDDLSRIIHDIFRRKGIEPGKQH